MNCLRTGRWHENDHFPKRERGGEEVQESCKSKVNKEVVLRENDSILCFVCLHSPVRNSKLCMTDMTETAERRPRGMSELGDFVL